MSLKLRMISHGLLAEAKGLDKELLGTGGEESESSEDVKSRMKRIMDSYEDEIKQRKEVKIRGLARDYRQQLVREYMKSIPTKKCMNCNVVGEKYRQEGYSKIFRVPLTRKDLKNNRKVAMLNEDDEERLSSSTTTQQESNATYVLPEESETQLKRVWQNESEIVSHVFNFTLAESKRTKFGSCPVAPTGSSTYVTFTFSCFDHITQITTKSLKNQHSNTGTKSFSSDELSYPHLDFVLLKELTVTRLSMLRVSC